MSDEERETMARFLASRLEAGRKYLVRTPKRGEKKNVFSIFEPPVADIGDATEEPRRRLALTSFAGTVAELRDHLARQEVMYRKARAARHLAEGTRMEREQDDEGEMIHLSLPLMRKQRQVIADIVDGPQRSSEESA